MRTRVFGLALTALAVIAMAGCGGGGGGGSSPTGGGGGTPSAYSGNYNGTIQSTVDNATTSFVVNSTGAINGTIKFSKLAAASPLTGSIDNGGNLAGTYTAGGHSYTATGPINQNPSDPKQYAAVIHVHDNTSNTNLPDAALNVARS